MKGTRLSVESYISAIMKYITLPTANLNEIIDLTNPIFIQ